MAAKASRPSSRSRLGSNCAYAAALDFETRGESGVDTRIDGLLGGTHGERCLHRDLPGQLTRRRRQRRRRDEAVGEPPLESFRCFQPAGGENHFLRSSHSDETGQALRAPRSRHDAEAHLGEADTGVLGEETQVASERQLEATAVSDAVHCRDGRERQPGYTIEGGADEGEVLPHLVEGESGAFLEIGTGAECLAGAAQDGAANGAILTRGLRRGAESAEERPVEGVQHLRSLQCPADDVFFPSDLQRLRGARAHIVLRFSWWERRR